MDGKSHETKLAHEAEGTILNWEDLRDSVVQGIESARKTISDMTGKEVKVLYELGGVFTLPNLPALEGSPEKIVTTSYVTFHGDVEGQLMIIFAPKAADKLAFSLEPDMAQDMLDSFAAEMANIIGSRILNDIADRKGLTIRPSPPVLIKDMAGAVIESALAMCLLSSCSVWVSDVKLGFEERDQLFEIVLMPKTLEGIEPENSSTGCVSWMKEFWS